MIIVYRDLWKNDYSISGFVEKWLLDIGICWKMIIAYQDLSKNDYCILGFVEKWLTYLGICRNMIDLYPYITPNGRSYCGIRRDVPYLCRFFQTDGYCLAHGYYFWTDGVSSGQIIYWADRFISTAFFPRNFFKRT